MGHSLTDANGSGLLNELKALAERLAIEIDSFSHGSVDEAKILPGLARQYRETVIKIDALESGTDSNDEIAAIILRNRKPDTD